MDITQAIQILNDKRIQRGDLEADFFTEMMDALEADALSDRDATALRVFLRQGSKLLAPVEA